mmetsp:Transcript_104121/g.271890  ORF Transcript_104121/g.271890 Transcript_104121/m.271890 type:complete len:330 (+) Transcript_104121:784-1773(+)
MLHGGEALRERETPCQLVREEELCPQLVHFTQRAQHLGPELALREGRGLQARLLLPGLAFPVVHPAVQLLPQVAGAAHLAVQLPAPKAARGRLGLGREVVPRRQVDPIGLAGVLPHRLRELVRLHRQLQLPQPGIEALRAEEQAEEDRGVDAVGALLHALLPLAVVLPPQLRVREHLVGVCQLLELGICLGVAWALVWMTLARFSVVGLLQLRGRGPRGHVQQVVVLRLLHLGAGRAPAGARGARLVVGPLVGRLLLQGAEVDVDPLAELLVPDAVLPPAPHRIRGVHDAAGDLGHAGSRAAHGDRRAADDARAEALQQAQRAAASGVP